MDKTPLHLWIVGGLSLLWNAFGAIDFTATVTSFEPYMGSFPQEAKDYWYSMPWWMFVVWGVGTWGAALGSLFLLLKRRLAVPFFGASLIGIVLTSLGSVIHPAPPGLSAWGFTAVIFVIGCGLFYYAMRMVSSGVLR